jgi:hypothetical protein
MQKRPIKVIFNLVILSFVQIFGKQTDKSALHASSSDTNPWNARLGALNGTVSVHSTVLNAFNGTTRIIVTFCSPSPLFGSRRNLNPNSIEGKN